MIALITMTGARPQQFPLCAKWMHNQTYKGKVTWIIVDDADPVTTNCVDEQFKPNWNIIKIYPLPKWKQGENTQVRNIKEGISYVKKLNNVKAIFFIEDDDYYKSIYLERMMARLGDHSLIGEMNTIYYNVVHREYFVNPNLEHSSLFQTVFKPEVIPVLENSYTGRFVDYIFWNAVNNKLLFNENNLSIGIKGMPGRLGIGDGHKDFKYPKSGNKENDFSGDYLRSLIGEDFKYYENYFSP